MLILIITIICSIVIVIIANHVLLVCDSLLAVSKTTRSLISLERERMATSSKHVTRKRGDLSRSRRSNWTVKRKEYVSFSVMLFARYCIRRPRTQILTIDHLSSHLPQVSRHCNQRDHRVEGIKSRKHSETSRCRDIEGYDTEFHGRGDRFYAYI